jgi:hypothetical protein
MFFTNSSFWATTNKVALSFISFTSKTTVMPNKANKSKDQSNIVKSKKTPTIPATQKEAKESGSPKKSNGGNKSNTKGS